MSLAMGSSMMDNSVITWLRSSLFDEAIKVNKEAGFADLDMDWLKRQFDEPQTYTMGCFDHRGLLLGWTLHRKRARQYQVIWICVREGSKLQGHGTSMLNRFKGWLSNDLDRRTIDAYVNEYNVKAQVFLRAKGFKCRPPEAGSSTYQFSFAKDQL